MKRCPACQNTYTDDTLQFCLQDGVPLEHAEPEADEQETVLRPGVPEAVTVDIKSARETGSSMPPSYKTEERPSQGSRTVIAILLTVLVMLVVFGIIGLSAYLYVNREKRTASATNINSESANGIESRAESDSTNQNSATKPAATIDAVTKPTAPPATQTPETSPTETPDPTKIKKEVSDRIYGWVSLAEARNLGPYMDFYGDRIDYYRKRGASRAFVRNDKSKAFSKYSTIRIRISSLSVSPSNDGQTAEAVFDKEWLFADADTRQTGKVRSRVVFRNIAGNWKIVSERDLKVYYVNK